MCVKEKVGETIPKMSSLNESALSDANAILCHNLGNSFSIFPCCPVVHSPLWKSVELEYPAPGTKQMSLLGVPRRVPLAPAVDLSAGS